MTMDIEYYFVCHKCKKTSLSCFKENFYDHDDIFWRDVKIILPYIFILKHATCYSEPNLHAFSLCSDYDFSNIREKYNDYSTDYQYDKKLLNSILNSNDWSEEDRKARIMYINKLRNDKKLK